MKNIFLKIIFILILITGVILPLYWKPPVSSPPPPPQPEISSATIGKGGLLHTSLQKEGFSQREIFLLEEALKPIFDFRKCHPDHRYEITRVSGKFKNLLQANFFNQKIKVNEISPYSSLDNGNYLHRRDILQRSKVKIVTFSKGFNQGVGIGKKTDADIVQF